MIPDTTSSLIPLLTDHTQKLDLAGSWKVCKWPFQSKEDRLARPQTSDEDWNTINQPGKVFYADPEAESKPVPNWNRVTLTHINPDDGALLRRRIEIPESWRGKQIRLRFDAVYPAGRFYCNGTLLGTHLSGLTPVEYDVTDLVEPGEAALIAVRLIRRHRFVQMDMPRHALEFAGLAQPACLFAVERCHIKSYHLISETDPELQHGQVQGTITLYNGRQETCQAHLQIKLTDKTGKLVAEETKTTLIPAGEQVASAVALQLEKPLPWNDEFPNLYQVTLQLQVAGQPDQCTSYRTGFRCFELGPNGAKLNGNAVKFRGVNHLTFHPEHGLYTPKDWLRQNLTLMKRANVNAIRTHFLGPRALAELCDEMGFYLLQELPLDWGTDYIHDPDWVPPAVLRLTGGVLRDRHHPSVMVWSVGNENMPKTTKVADAGWANLRGYEELVKTLDPSRPTMFPPPGPANTIDGIVELRVGDIADTHYSFRHIKRLLSNGEVENPNSWEGDMRRVTRDEALARGWSGVWFSSEYGIFNGIPDLLHSPYQSLITDHPEEPLSGKSTLAAFEERLAREWGFLRDEPSCLGGAYFPWLCCGAGSAEAGNPWGWVRWGEDADWGVITADLLPKPFFWALRVLFSPIRFPERVTWQPGETEITFTTHNHFNAIDLQDCVLRTQQNGAGNYMSMMRPFRDVPMTGAPGKEVKISIPLWNKDMQAGLNKGKFGLCRCTLLAPDGFKVLVADILIIPAATDQLDHGDATMPIGPDAKQLH